MGMPTPVAYQAKYSVRGYSGRYDNLPSDEVDIFPDFEDEHPLTGLDYQSKPLNGWYPVEGPYELTELVVGFYAYRIEKEDDVIYVINASQYSNVCEYELVYFSDNEKSLNKFIEDTRIGEDSSIEYNEILMYWS